MALIGTDLALDGTNATRVDGDDAGGSGRSYSLRGFATGDPGTPANIKVAGADFDPATEGASVGPVVNVQLEPGEALWVGATTACSVAVVKQGVASA